MYAGRGSGSEARASRTVWHGGVLSSGGAAEKALWASPAKLLSVGSLGPPSLLLSPSEKGL